MAYLNETGLLTLWNKIKTKATEIAGTSVSTHNDSASAHSDIRSAVSAKYTKPSGGIPKSDMASDVQTSLGKADTAIQDISMKADDSAVVHNTGAETVAGVKTFSAAPVSAYGFVFNAGGTIGMTKSNNSLYVSNGATAYLGINGAETTNDFYITRPSGHTYNSGNIVTDTDMNTALSGKESTSNKTTAISGSPTDAQYPSAKAVKTYVDAQATGRAYQGTLANEAALTSLTNYKSGWYWFANGSWDSASLGIHIDSGNMLIAKAERATYTASDFNVIQADIEAIPDSVINALD